MEYPFKDLQPLDEATARTGYYRDWSHIDADTFHQISELVNFIREKGYGSDTREAIAQALERVYHDALMSGNANMEVSMARKHFKDLASRLDASDDELTSATARLTQVEQQKISHGEVTVSDIDKNKGKLDQTFMTEEFLQQIAGNTPINSVPADGSLTTEKFADNSVGFKKLTDNFMYDVETNAIGSSHNLDNIIKTGSYLLTGLPINKPPQTPQTGMVHVFSTNTNYITQIYQDIDNRMFLRIKTANYSGFSDWQELLTETDKDSLMTAIENNGSRKYPYLQETDDLNSLISDGRWVAIGSENNPFNRSEITWLVDVKVYKTSESTKAGWGTQFVTPIQHNHNVAFIRRFALSSSGEPTFREWLDLSDKTPLSHLTEKTILNFGDSIFGNTDDDTSVSSNISKITGANVLNIGFGGSRVAAHDAYWDAFSWYRLVDEIIKPDSDPTKWVLQDEAISASEGGAPLGMPTYFKSRLQRLKGIDFNNVYGLTLAAGTNDFASNKVDLDDDTNRENTITYAGSLRHGIRKLQQTYPNIKILLCTPIYRFWIEDGVVVEDSDDKIVRNQKLTDFVEKTLEVGKEFKLPTLDNYYQLGINEYNRANYFPSTDGTHPNQNGRELLGNKIGAELLNCF